MNLSSLKHLTRLPGFWRGCAFGVLFAALTVLHYSEQLGLPYTTSPSAHLGLTRHTLERILFLMPVAYAGFVFGIRGGGVAVALALAVMLPRAILLSPTTGDAVAETLTIGLIGALTAAWFEGQLRHERRRRELIATLTAIQTELRSQIQVVRNSERRLAAVNAVATIANQSLQLRDVLDAVADKVMEVMEADVALVFLLDESRGDLALEVYRGASDEFAAQLARMDIGEGLNGAVAAEGKAMIVEDASSDPRLTREIVRREGIGAELIAPITYLGRVVGTATLAMRSPREFVAEDLEVLTLIGQQIGIAVGNARLFEQQLETSERLRASEENYRELFENAQDPIWVQDVGGMILAANRACLKLTGYRKAELIGMSVSQFLTENSEAFQARVRLLRGETVEQPYEQRLRRRDGSEAVLQLSVRLISSGEGEGGRPLALQFIARDVTEEKRLQENLRFYRRQVTMAQEEERKRIARDLHDETAQGLVALSHRLDALASDQKALEGGNRGTLEELQEQVDHLLGEVRRFARELRPSVLDHLGLVPALEGLASEISEWYAIDVGVEVQGEARRLSPEIELGLFRIVQEALRNVCKHAEATRIDAALEFSPGLVRMAVRDNGKGFDLPKRLEDLPSAGKLGLLGMEERAELLGGRLSLESRPGEGTTVTMEVAA